MLLLSSMFYMSSPDFVDYNKSPDGVSNFTHYQI